MKSNLKIRKSEGYFPERIHGDKGGYNGNFPASFAKTLQEGDWRRERGEAKASPFLNSVSTEIWHFEHNKTKNYSSISFWITR